MQPIYTSKRLPNKAIQSADYVQRGLDGLTTGRLEDLFFVGRPHVVQPLYAQYVGNLPAFLYSTAIHRKVTCGGTYWPPLALEKMLPLALPPLTLAPVKPFTKDEDKASYKEKLPQNTITTTYLKRECYVVPTPTVDLMKNIPPADRNVPSSSDSVSLSGMQAFLTTLKIVSLFLATHTYPAFQTDQDDGDKASEDVDLVIQTPTVASPHHRGYEDTYKKRTRAVVWDQSELQPAPEVVDITEDNLYSAYGTVYVAKPAPLYPAVNYGPPSAIPSLPGFVLPYFPGIVYPSETAIISIMRRFFLGCFGDSPDSGTSRWSQWRNSVSKWYRTKSGVAISHILFCLQTALECQGRLFVILHGSTYLGSAILGFKFSIDCDGILVAPGTPTVVRKLVADLDDHEKAIMKISSILKGMALLGESDINMDIEVDLSSPRNLYRELTIRERPNEEKMEEMLEQVRKLAYPQKYWSISGDTVARAVTMMVSSTPVDGKLPMYLDPGCIFMDQSRFFDVLSVFGPQAPSMIDSAGKEVSIPRGLEASDPMSEVPKDGTSILMPKLFLSPKKLHLAVNDWRGVFRRRKIRQNAAERAGGYRTISIVGVQRDKVWSALKMIPWENTGKGKGKRAAEEDEEPEDRAAKKPKEGPVDEGLGDY
jgi:hypothetical protein